MAEAAVDAALADVLEARDEIPPDAVCEADDTVAPVVALLALAVLALVDAADVPPADPTFCTIVNALLPKVFCQQAKYDPRLAASIVGSTRAVLQVNAALTSQATEVPAASRVLAEHEV